MFSENSHRVESCGTSESKPLRFMSWKDLEGRRVARWRFKNCRSLHCATCWLRTPSNENKTNFRTTGIHVDRCSIRNVVYFLCLVWRTVRAARERGPLQFEAFNRYLIAIGDRWLYSLYTRLRRNVFSAPFDQTSPAYCARMYINWKAL